MVTIGKLTTPSIALERATPTRVARVCDTRTKAVKAVQDRVAPRDTFERSPVGNGKRAKAAAGADKAALDSFKLINELGNEARKLKADLASSDANRTITDQSTSENMSSKEFKLFSKSSKFSSHVLGKAFDYVLENGLGGNDNPRLSPAERTQIAGLAGDLKRSLLRSKDSALTAGERHQASQAVADSVIALQEFANKKATDTIVEEGKKALDDAGKYLDGLFTPR